MGGLTPDQAAQQNAQSIAQTQAINAANQPNAGGQYNQPTSTPTVQSPTSAPLTYNPSEPANSANNRQVLASQQHEADVAAAARQNALAVTGAGKSQAQYQNEVINAYVSSYAGTGIKPSTDQVYNFAQQNNLNALHKSYTLDINEGLGLGDVVGAQIQKNQLQKSIANNLSIQDQITVLKNQKPLPETTGAALMAMGPGAYNSRDQDFADRPIPENIAANKANADLISSLTTQASKQGTSIIGDAIPHSNVISLSNQKAPWDTFKYLGRPESTVRQAAPQVVKSDIGNLDSLTQQYKTLGDQYSLFPKEIADQQQYNSAKEMYGNLQSLYGRIKPAQEQSNQLITQQNNDIKINNALIGISNKDIMIGNVLAQSSNDMARANYELDVASFSSGLVERATKEGAKSIQVGQQTVTNAGEVTLEKYHPLQILPLSKSSPEDIANIIKSTPGAVFSYTPAMNYNKIGAGLEFDIADPFEKYAGPVVAGAAKSVSNAAFGFISGAYETFAPEKFAALPSGFADIAKGNVKPTGLLGIPAPSQPVVKGVDQFNLDYGFEDPLGNAIAGQGYQTKYGIESDIGYAIGTGGMLAVNLPSAIRGGASLAKYIPTLIKGVAREPKPVTLTPEMLVTDTLREGRAVYDLSQVNKNTFEFNQGTVAKSGNVSPDIMALRVPTEMVPGMPNYSLTKLTKLPPGSNEIIGIGSKGEMIPTGKGTVKIPNPKIEVQAQIPQAFLTPGKVSFIRSEPSGLTENNFLAQNIDETTAKQLGLKPTGSPRTYTGPANSDSLRLIRGMMDQGKIAKVTDIFEYSPEDLGKNPADYFKPIRNPTDVENLEALRQGKIVAPSITGYYEGTFTGNIKKIVSKTNSRPFKPMKPFDEQTKQSKGSTASGSRTQSILIKPEATMKKIFGDLSKTQQKENSSYPVYVPSELAKQRTKYQGGRSELISEIVTYPKGTPSSIEKLLGKSPTKTGELQQPLYINLKDLIKTPKNSSKDRLITTTTERIQISNGKQALRLGLENILTQRSFAKQGTTSILRSGQIQLPKQFTTTRQGQYQVPGLVQRQDQIPTQTFVQQQIQKPIMPRLPSPPPPVLKEIFQFRSPGFPFRLGGAFDSGGRGGASSRRLFSVTGESENIFIKYLPESKGHPFLESSGSSSIFAKKEAYDKHIQDLVFGGGKKSRSSAKHPLADYGFVTPKRISKHKKR